MERTSIQRDIVLEEIRHLKSHITADELFNDIKQKYQHISRSTVYRNLQWLCDKGMLRKRSIPGQADVYDAICTNHYHVRCATCGRVFDVDMPYMDDIGAHIKDRRGFTFLSHDIIFTGICPECQKKTD